MLRARKHSDTRRFGTTGQSRPVEELRMKPDAMSATLNEHISLVSLGLAPPKLAQNPKISAR
jgi:hypothetical protein